MNTQNPYQPPASDIELPDDPHEYVGYWKRLLASFIDTILIMLITWPILFFLYGEEYFTSTQFVHGFWDVILSYVFPAVAVIAFWRYKAATPGKMIFGARIVDAGTGNEASTGQLIGRYFAYIPSTLAIGLGFLWIAWDPRKQGWHDKLARTVVVASSR